MTRATEAPQAPAPARDERRTDDAGERSPAIDRAREEMRCTLCGLRACWTKP